jgi:hypothetical protein
MNIPNKILKFDATLFWDANLQELDLEKDYFYIIKRIILRGDRKDRKAMFSAFSKDKIVGVIKNTREIETDFKETLLKAIHE